MTRARDLAVRHAKDIHSNFELAAKGIDLAFTGLQAGQGLATLARLPQLARSAVLAFAGFQTIKMALNEVSRASQAAQERLEELVKIAKQAQGAGVGTTFLQSLTGQAKALGTEAQSLVSMLERAREASTVRIGEGTEAASSAILDRLRQNVAAGNLAKVDLDKFTNAESQEARIRVILELIDQLRAKGAQLAALDLAGRMFGAEFEAKLRTGTDMIGAMRRALDGLQVGADGRIIPPEEIARAESMKAQLREIEDKLANALKPLNEDIALWQQQQLQGWIDIKAQLADVVVLAGQVYGAIKSVGDYISSLGNAKPFQALRDWLDSVGAIDKAEVARIERMLNGGLTADKPAVPKDADANGPLQISVKPKADTSRPLPSLSTPKAAGSSAAEVDEIQRFINQLDKSTVSLKAQVDTFHLSNSEQAVALQLARAQEIAKQNNRTLTEEETRRIREAATAASTYKDKLADLAQAQQQGAELARTLGNALSDSFADAILEGKSFGDILNDLTKQLAKMALQAAFTGQGPLAGLFGTAPAASEGSSAVGGLAGMFKGLFGFADGGHVTGPGTGRSDSIMARLSNGEFVVNADATREHLPIIHAINKGASAEDLQRLITGSNGKDETAVRPAQAVTRTAEQIVYRDRLEAAGVRADLLPQVPERPSPELTAAVRAVVIARLMHDAASPSDAVKGAFEPADRLGDIIVSVRDGLLAIQAPKTHQERRRTELERVAQLPAFATGGMVQGPGGPREDRVIARLSPGEFVINAAATARHRAVLESINSGSVNLPKFADGGFVGGGSAPRMRETGSSAAPVVTIAPVINLHAAGGSQEANADLAARVGQQIEGSIRGLVVSELRAQLRPMGILNR